MRKGNPPRRPGDPTPGEGAGDDALGFAARLIEPMTDRRVEVDDVADLAFDARGLLPVVAQDVDSGAVLMLAWANREAVEATLAEGVVHFWSRSREELWRKGETSGNTLELVSLHADCDGDTLLARVRPAGPACHTGEATCFGAGAVPDAPDVLQRLDDVLRRRAAERPQGSYTVRLLDDENLRLKKLGEETVELVTALARGEPGSAVEEGADLLYHLLVALRAEGADLADLREALEKRAD